MKRALKAAGICVLLTSAVALAGCGGSMGADNSSPSGTKPSGSPPTVTSDPPPSASASDPPAASAPTATNGSLAALMGAVSTGTLSGQGPDALTYAITVPPQNGTATLTNAATGTFTYTSYPNFTGQDSFQFTVTNASGTSQPATETLNVTSSAIGAEQTVTNIGISIESVCYWCASQPYVDVMKQAGSFYDYTTAGNPLLIEIGKLDADGWPETDFKTFVLNGSTITGNGPMDPGNAPILTGDYQLSFTGKADVQNVGYGSVSNLTYDAATNTTTATVTVALGPTGQVNLTLQFSNTQRTASAPTGTGVTNIKLIRPQFAPDGSKWWNSPTQEFTNPFLDSFKGFSTIRYMNWTMAIGSPEVNWADRTPANWPVTGHSIQAAASSLAYLTKPLNCAQHCDWYATGQSWESAIDLANATHTDMWINIPVMATDDYVKSLATLIKSKLDAGLHVYVEWSDEIWNYGNPWWTETQYNDDQTTALLATDPTAQANYAANCAAAYAYTKCRIAERLMQISNDFASVYGQAAINTTIRPVLAFQLYNYGMTEIALAYIAATYAPPTRYFYAIGGAPYWNPTTALPAGSTENDVIGAMNAAVGMNVGKLAGGAATALFYGLHTFTYEGGPALDYVSIAGATSAQLTAILDQANVDPAMHDQVINGLTKAFQSGVDMYMYYSSQSAGTHWGATPNQLHLEAPKYTGLRALQNTLITRNVGTALPGTITLGPSVFGVDSKGNAVPQSLVSGWNCMAAGTTPAHCSDTGAAVDTGPVYLATVAQAGTYAASLVMFTGQNGWAGSVDLVVDKKVVGTFTFDKTDAGVSLTVGPIDVVLTAGMHLIGLSATGAKNFSMSGINFVRQ